MAIEHGSQSVVPYVLAKNASQLIAFLTEAFGAEEMLRVPTAEGAVMHAEIRVGDSLVEMADGNPTYPAAAMALHLYVPDADAVYRKALESGATSLREPVGQAYGDRESGIVDPNGNCWWIATHLATGDKPEGFRSVTPYLIVNGADQFLEFLKAVFAAEEVSVTRSPEGALRHSEMRIGNSLIEASEAHAMSPIPGVLHVFVADVDAVYARAVAAGAISEAAPQDKPYGERGAAVKDSWGNSWYLAQVLV